MKLRQTITVFAIGILAASTNEIYGQAELPNSNFENWTTADSGQDSLVGWSSSNSDVVEQLVSMEQSTDAFQGEYAVALFTTPFGFTGASTIGMMANGNAVFSTFNQVTYESGGGTPVSFQPTGLSGYYKFESSQPGDQGWAEVTLTRYNETLGERDTVSYGSLNFPPEAEYAGFIIPLAELMPDTEPDSITVLFYSSNPATVETFYTNSTFLLDSLELWNDPTGFSFSDQTINRRVYPNPATDKLVVESDEAIDDLMIFNSHGQFMKRIDTVLNNRLKVDVSEFPAGMYFFVFDGEKDRVEKVIVR